MKRVVLVAATAVVIGLGAWAYLHGGSGGNAPKYQVARVERGRLSATVSASGTLAAVTTVQVSSQVSGQIKQLLADFNSPVRRGQVIARLDPASFETRVNQARAEIESAEATVGNHEAQVERALAEIENARGALAEAKANTARAQVVVVDARRDLDRKEELLRGGLIARSERDTAHTLHAAAVTQVDGALAREQSALSAIRAGEAQVRVLTAMLRSARAQVKQKQGALDQALVDLGHTTIRAPIDGIVVSRAVDVGQTVAASLQAPTLFTITGDLGRMQVETSVIEADIVRIEVGARATFTVDALPRQPFEGRVVQVRKAAQNIQNVVTYTVLVAADNSGGRLLPGMTANVKLIVVERTQVLKVPNAALRFRVPEAAAAAAERAPADAGGAGTMAPSAGGAAGSEGSSTRERLVSSLGLTPAQQQTLDRILADSREARRALKQTVASDDQRTAEEKKLRDVRRARIREILTPEQRARYDQVPSGGGTPSEGSATAGRVWVPGANGQPRAVTLTLGLTDGSATEVLRGDLAEGQEVIVGLAGSTPEPKQKRASGKGGREPRLGL